MQVIRSRRALWSSLLLLGAALAGCNSAPVKVAPTPPDHYQKLGAAEGSACGTMLLIHPAYYAIPVGLSDRVQKAYDNAVKSVPDATGLVDVTMQEDWYWWLLGTNRCVTIKGEAIK